MAEIKLKKVGGSVCITISPDLLERYNLKEGDWVDIDFSKIIKLRAVKMKEKK